MSPGEKMKDESSGGEQNEGAELYMDEEAQLARELARFDRGSGVRQAASIALSVSAGDSYCSYFSRNPGAY